MKLAGGSISCISYEAKGRGAKSTSSSSSYSYMTVSLDSVRRSYTKPPSYGDVPAFITLSKFEKIYYVRGPPVKIRKQVPKVVYPLNRRAYLKKQPIV